MAYGDIVQSKSTWQFSGTTVAVTLDSTPTEGNLLVACMFSSKQPVTQPSGWSSAVYLQNDGNSDDGEISYKVAGSGESTSVSCGTGGSGDAWLYVVEFEGPWNATPLDKTAQDGPNEGQATQTSGTTATTAQNDEVAVAMVGGEDVGPNASVTNSFVERYDTGNQGAAGKEGAVATKLLTSTGTVETTFDIDNSNYDSIAGVATFKKSVSGSPYTLVCAQGSIAYTGQTVGLIADRTLAIAQGSYTLSGQAIGLIADRVLALAQGSYALTGQEVGLIADRTLALAQGSYALTGQSAALNRGYPLVCAQGSYALTGQTAELIADRLLTAAQGSYALTGQTVALTIARILVAAQGSYSLTGQDITLTYTPVGAYELVCAQGSIALTGQSVGLIAARVLTAVQGSYSLTGQTSGLYAGRSLVAAQGSYALTGQQIALVIARTIAAVAASYALTGQDIALTYDSGLSTPLERTFFIAAENRVYIVGAEDRAYPIENEDRIYPI